jgi:nitroimidazol reductase NimA-like FMN-containing flavoprotein (pyridoxamine 5'-phosphate oxidase superfamily)
MSADTAVRIATFLDANHVMSLATCGAEGPHAASVFYVRDGLALLWVSDPESRHSAQLEANAPPQQRSRPIISIMKISEACKFQGRRA